MAPDDRKIKCTTRLGALNVPGLEARRTKPRSLMAFAHCSVTFLVRGKITWHPHTKVFLCIARFQRRFVDNIGGLYGWFFAGDTLVFTLGLIKYEPRWFGPTDKIVKVRLQGITVCDGIDALEKPGIIDCNLQGQNTRTKNPSKSLNTVRDIKRTRRKVKEVTWTDLLNQTSMFLAQRSQLDTEESTRSIDEIKGP